MIVLPAVATAPGPDAAAGEAKAAVAPSVEASLEKAPGDPLEDALAALDRKDYATAQRLFEALGRKGTAAGIEDALAALDRKDYASANRLFEALGQMGSVGATPKASAGATPAQAKPAAPARGATVEKAEKAPPKLEFIPRVEAAYRRPQPPAEKSKRRSLTPALMGTGPGSPSRRGRVRFLRSANQHGVRPLRRPAEADPRARQERDGGRACLRRRRPQGAAGGDRRAEPRRGRGARGGARPQHGADPGQHPARSNRARLRRANG